jgi:hypothetical protein
MITALSFAEVEAIRNRFSVLARWSGMPIVPDRLQGRKIVTGEGVPSSLKFADPMIGADGVLGEYSCYTPSLRRFAIHPAEGDGPWRTSENTLGVMVNPTDLAPKDFAQACYGCLLAWEKAEPFEADWLDEPALWPKRITRTEDLKRVRRSIPDLRPSETVVYGSDLLGTCRFIARYISGVAWPDLDWRDEEGRGVQPRAAKGSALGGLSTWRDFLERFLAHPVPFSLDEEGRRATGQTKGVLSPAPILIVGIARTGRTDWVEGTAAEVLVPDANEPERMREELGRVSGADLAKAGLAPRTVRAMRAGRPPSRRNAQAALNLVVKRARARAGLEPDGSLTCAAPGCPERLTGRQGTFCTRHATYPGSRRKAWKEAAGR